jgi:hypothetical protein
MVGAYILHKHSAGITAPKIQHTTTRFYLLLLVSFRHKYILLNLTHEIRCGHCIYYLFCNSNGSACT